MHGLQGGGPCDQVAALGGLAHVFDGGLSPIGFADRKLIVQASRLVKRPEARMALVDG